MRVIAGKARRVSLKTIEGMETRPTTDRIKETLFNMISFDLADSRFLDIFGGSGAIGIEALSRGAEHAWFIEMNPKAVQCIKDNLKATGLESQATVLSQEAVGAVKMLGYQEKAMDFIFMDPPYRMNLEKDILMVLKDSNLVDEYTTIIVEASLETDFSYVSELGFDIYKEKIYKTNKHIFLKKNEG